MLKNVPRIALLLLSIALGAIPLADSHSYASTPSHDTGEPLRIARYSHDRNGNLLSETLVNGTQEQPRRFEYDAHRRTKITDAEGQSSVLDYTAAGNLVSEVNARLHRTTYAYDALNRRTRQVLPANIVTQYQYDKVGNLTEERQPNGNVVVIAYDALNRPLRSSDSLGPLSETEYDANGNRTLERNARELVTLNRYNALNQLIEQQLGRKPLYSSSGAINVLKRN